MSSSFVDNDDSDDLLLLSDVGDSIVGDKDVQINSNLSWEGNAVGQGEIKVGGGTASGNNNNGGGSDNKPKGTGMCWCFSISAYQPYFDVDTMDVLDRIMESFKVWKRTTDTQDMAYFIKEVLPRGGGPDAYGPFWITMTLVFVVAVTSNINSWFNASAQDFEGDISALLHAFWVIYAFSFGIPIVSWGALKCLGEGVQGLDFMTLLCLFGYSLLPYIPAALVCAIPITALHWVALFGAMAFSSGLVMRNLIGPVMEGGEKKSRALLGWFAGCQFVMFFVMKIVFF